MNHQHSKDLGPSPSPIDKASHNRNRVPRHLQERLEAGVSVDLEGLSKRDAGLLAEVVARQAAEMRKLGFNESSAIKRSRTLPGTTPQRKAASAS